MKNSCCCFFTDYYDVFGLRVHANKMHKDLQKKKCFKKIYLRKATPFINRNCVAMKAARQNSHLIHFLIDLICARVCFCSNASLTCKRCHHCKQAQCQTQTTQFRRVFSHHHYSRCHHLRIELHQFSIEFPPNSEMICILLHHLHCNVLAVAA